MEISKTLDLKKKNAEKKYKVEMRLGKGGI